VKNIAAIFLSMILTALTAVGVRAENGDGAVDGSPRNRGYGFLMLEEPVNPRNAAMGSVGTALGGYGFRYYNPALPFFSPDMSSYASAEFGRMPGEVNKGGFETATFFSSWFGAISFFSSAVDFRTSDERGLSAPASSGTTVGALSAGYIRDDLAAGVSFSMADDRIWADDAYGAAALSFGLGYKMFDGKLGLGAAWMNAAAWSHGFAGDGPQWRGGRVPVFARVGAAWADTQWTFPYTVAADVAYRDEDGTISVPIGLEVKVLPYISLRIGKRIGWENEVASLGIGFNMDRLSFDAAFIPTVFVDDYEMKWSMGFTYNIGKRKKTEPVKNAVVPAKGSAPPEEESEQSEEDLDVIEEEVESTEEEPVSAKDETAPTDGTTAKDEAAPPEE